MPAARRSSVRTVSAGAARDAGARSIGYARREQKASFRPGSTARTTTRSIAGFDFTVPEVDDLADFHGDLDRSEARALCRRQLFLRDGAAGAGVRGRSSRIQGAHLLGNDSAGAARQADRGGRPHHRRQHDLDGEARRLSCRPREGERVDRAGPADRTRRALRHQRSHDHGAQGQSGARHRPRRSRQARPASGHAESRIRGRRPADQGRR